MENISNSSVSQSTDTSGIKDIIQNSPIPDWFPDPVKEKLSGYGGSNKDRLVQRIVKNLESGLDVIATEFNRPTFDRSAKLKTERERTKLLSAIGINRETLDEYTRTGGYQEHPEEAFVIHQSAKKELIGQIWKVTSRAWENDRSRREREDAKHDYTLPHRVNRERYVVKNIINTVGNWTQGILGNRELNKMADRIMAIQPGVENTLREYDVE